MNADTFIIIVQTIISPRRVYGCIVFLSTFHMIGHPLEANVVILVWEKICWWKQEVITITHSGCCMLHIMSIKNGLLLFNVTLLSNAYSFYHVLKQIPLLYPNHTPRPYWFLNYVLCSSCTGKWIGHCSLFFNGNSSAEYLQIKLFESYHRHDACMVQRNYAGWSNYIFVCSECKGLNWLEKMLISID